MPVPVLLQPHGLRVPQQTVLLLPGPNVHQPTPVELALASSLLPCEQYLREEVLVASLAVELLPVRGGMTGDHGDRQAQYNKKHVQNGVRLHTFVFLLCLSANVNNSPIDGN